MDFREIGHMRRGVLDLGKLRIQVDGFVFKSGRTGKLFQVRDVDIERLEWLRVAKGFEVKVITKDGNIYKFDGFKESDYVDLREFFRSQFGKELREVELCVKGWNWGEPRFDGSLFSFLVDSKPAFEIPLREVSRVTSGKNEVTLEFHQSEDAPVSLVEMRFHIPNTDGEDDPVQAFHHKVLSQADVMQATGDAIAIFKEIQTLTPRGRYAIKAYPTFLQLHGKTFDYKIPYETIARLFLLPHNDQRQMFFVLSLDPPIRQGQTRYYFVIFLLPTDEDCDITLGLPDEELQQRYEGKLTHEMSGTLYEVFSRILRVLVGKKITAPGSVFRTNNNQYAIVCSNRATSGYLYPLDKGFLFVHKPAVHIRFDKIASVNFARMTGSAGISRSFDFEVEMKDGNTHHFSSLMKEDYNRLFEFVSEKHLRIKNNKGKVQAVKYNDEASSESGHDAYLEKMKAEGEERDSSSEDEDFIAKESGSEDDLEYDSDAKSESGSEGEEEEPERATKTRKRKRDSSRTAPRPAKKKKEDGGGRKKKDPNAPKKPMPAYFLWLQEHRPFIKEKFPGISVTEIGKKAGEMWREVEDKSKWTQEAEVLKQQYQKDLAAYKASGAAAAYAATPSHSKAKPKKSKPATTKSKSKSPSKPRAVGKTDQKKYKSAEFVKSEDDRSSGEETEKRGKSSSGPSRSMRSKRSGEEVGSLPSEESSAESSGDESGEDSGEESD